jgi:hypothetical protein
MNGLRKLARTVAKNQMKKKGMVQICKDNLSKNSISFMAYTGSYFSWHWKDYVKY